MYTDECVERVIFPETPLYNISVSVVTRKVSSGEKIFSNIKSPTDLNDSKFTVGVVTGSATGTFVPKILPNAKLKQFSGVNEMILALEQKKNRRGSIFETFAGNSLKRTLGQAENFGQATYCKR